MRACPALRGLLSQCCDNNLSRECDTPHGPPMKIGCGFVEKEIHGNRYLYFWHFQVRASGVRKIEKYMGPADSTEARRRTLQEIEAYTARATAELEGRVAEWRRELAKV